MPAVEDFDREVKAALSKGKALSASTVTSITKLALSNMAGDDAHLVATLFRQHKKASSTSKIYSLYLIDAIAREARSLAKKAAKDLSLQDAGYSTFIAKLEAILSKLVVDCWENGKLEHREKVRKVLDIWAKANTFGSSSLKRIDQKLASSAGVGEKPEDISPDAVSTSALPIDNTYNGLPPSVAALFGSSKPTEAPALSVNDEVERAIAAAKAGVSATAPQPQPPPASSFPAPASAPSFDPAMFDLSKLAALQQTLDSVNKAPALAPAPGPSTGMGAGGWDAQQGVGGGGWAGQHQQSQQQGVWGGQQQQGGWQNGQGYSQQQQQPQSQEQYSYGAGSSNGYEGGQCGEGLSTAAQRPGGAPPRRVVFDTSKNRQYDDPRSRSQSQDAVDESPDRPQTRRRSPTPPPTFFGQTQEQEHEGQPPRKKRWDASGPASASAAVATPTPAAAESRPAPPSRPPISTRPGIPLRPPAMQQQPQVAPAQSPKPFDPLTFDPTSPASWEAFAPHLRAMNGGQMPSMQMVMQWCWMMQMQAQAMQQMGAGGGMGMGMGMGGAMGGVQGMGQMGGMGGMGPMGAMGQDGEASTGEQADGAVEGSADGQ